MATRSLTEVFILMRNNALQTRNIFNEQADDRMALVPKTRRDAEAGITTDMAGKLPPDWIDLVEQTQYEMSRIKQRTKDLSSLHNKHLNRPTMDDNVDEEHEIDITTQDITQMFTRSQRLVHTITAKCRTGTESEQLLSKNIISSLARSLQEMSISFRKTQSSYLKRLKNREERSRHYFDTNIVPDTSQSGDEQIGNSFYQGFSEVQLQMVETNSSMIQQREVEIKQVVQSILDLNEIFKDLGSMIVDQGSILDCIDYNIENSHTHVERGLKQLQKAGQHQKKNRKMLVISVLAAIVIIMIIILIGTKG